MSRIVLSVVLFAAMAFVVSSGNTNVTAQQNESLNTALAINGVLKAQVAAWNSGNVRGFMDGYVKSERLRFASGGAVTTGWQKTLDRYLERYTSPEIMGTLEFKDLKIEQLSPVYAEVFGSWHLARTKEVGNVSGLFTLLMKKTKDGWRVFHDHTSSATTE